MNRRYGARSLRFLVSLVLASLVTTSLVETSHATTQGASRVVTVHFSSNSSALSSSARVAIRKLAKKSATVDYYVVTGYVQNSGSDLNNTWLSLRRAKMVRGFMRKSGITAPIKVRSGGVPKRHGKFANARRVTIVAFASTHTPRPTPTNPSTATDVTVNTQQSMVDIANQNPSSPLLQAIWNVHGIPSCGMGGCEHSMYLDSNSKSLTLPGTDWDVSIQNDTNYLSIVTLNGATNCPRDSNSPNMYVCEHVNNGDVITVTQGALKTFTISGSLFINVTDTASCSNYGVTKLVLGGDNFAVNRSTQVENLRCRLDWSFSDFPSTNYSAQLFLTCSAPSDCFAVTNDSSPWSISNLSQTSLTLTANSDISVAGGDSPGNEISLNTLAPPP